MYIVSTGTFVTYYPKHAPPLPPGAFDMHFAVIGRESDAALEYVRRIMPNSKIKYKKLYSAASDWERSGTNQYKLAAIAFAMMPYTDEDTNETENVEEAIYSTWNESEEAWETWRWVEPDASEHAIDMLPPARDGKVTIGQHSSVFCPYCGAGNWIYDAMQERAKRNSGGVIRIFCACGCEYDAVVPIVPQESKAGESSATT